MRRFRVTTAALYRVRPFRGTLPCSPFQFRQAGNHKTKGETQLALTGARMPQAFMSEKVNDGTGTGRERRAAQREILQRQIEQLENRLKQVSQREQRESRKRDTQLKILAGAILLADVEAGKTDRAQVAAMFKRGAKRDRDVKLLQEEGWLP